MTEINKPIVVNLYAGPGKSTSCAQIFSELKQNGVNCEMVREFASINIFLERNKQFNPKGRLHNEEKARLLDTKIKLK